MTLFTTAYFPSISYMARFLQEDAPVVEVWETYRKQTYRNRCRVMTANGVEILSVPVVKVNGNHTMTKDIIISPVEPWQHIHSRCLESAYKAAPYFDHYYDYLRPMFEGHFERLIDLNDAALQAVLRMLKVKKEMAIESTSFPKYYQVFSTKFPFAADLSVLDLVFNEGPEATNYLKQIF